jgi:hypothetical protein
MIEVLMGRADCITVEAVDPDADAVEFFLLRDGKEEGHQAKRQWQDRANWSISLLEGQGILEAAAAMVRNGRRFHFVSTLPSRPLSDLAEAAQRSADYSSFSALISGNKKLGDAVADLARVWGTPDGAWTVLRSFDVTAEDERQLHATNVALAQWLFLGRPEAAVAVLREIVDDNLGVALTADSIWRELERRGIEQNPLRDEHSMSVRVATVTDRLRRDAQTALLHPSIPRAETDEVLEALRGQSRQVMLVGEAGAGKSAVGAAVVDAWAADPSAAVLAFRLDRYMDARSSIQLGKALDLDVSPVVALGAAAAGLPALLVVDQLDAVSLASGRSPEVFGVVEELLLEAAAFPNLKVLLCCRRFDIDNDHRLKALVDPKRPEPAHVVEVAHLHREQVESAVAEMNLDPSRLDERQIQLLSLPLNLVLLRTAAAEADALTFSTTRDLLELFWKTKRRAVLQRRADTRFERVVEVLVNAMSSSQRLTASQAVLHAENLDDDIDVLASENLVVRDGQRITFFHESIFDYAFARQWVTREQSLVDFLVSSEQELFRRVQVRQVLLHLRDADPRRFVSDVRTVILDESVRFHVKDSILALLRSLTDPSENELALMLELLDMSPWRSRVELALRTESWFDRLDAAGAIDKWLSSGDRALEERAVTILGSVAGERPGRAAQLLSPHLEHPDFVPWLMWVVRFGELDEDRDLLELLLDTMRRGLLDDRSHEVFLAAHRLGEREPAWGVELLSGWFVERPNAFAVDADRVVALRSSDHGLLELIQHCATGAPERFVARLLPYMQKAMVLAEQGADLPRRDWHFSSQLWNSYLSEADDMLFHAMVEALRALATADPARLRELVEPLVEDIHAAAQDLLYEALTAAGPAHADWSASLVLRGGAALESGYSGSDYWRTRELLRATAPHMAASNFEAVERLVVDFTSDWERRSPDARGHASFVLSSALPESRMSDSAQRRLGELRRKFGRDQPEPPQGVVGGFVGPPIDQHRAERMNDKQWIGAMRRHSTDEGDWKADLRGGASQLSQVLKAETEKDPRRFAQLALTLDPTFNANYLQGILLGLGDTSEDVDASLVFDVMRHAAADERQDRWVGWPLKQRYREEIPDDIVSLLLARALWRADSPGGGEIAEEPGDMGEGFMSGLNSDRGGNAYVVARLVAFDPDGRRAAIVAPRLRDLADDPSASVRTCIAEIVHAMLRWDRPAALEAFTRLARDRDAKLVSSDQFEALTCGVIVVETAVALPVIEDLLTHEDTTARERGARLLAFAATDGDRPEMLERAVGSDDVALRTGAAHVLAGRVRWVNEPLVTAALAGLFDDDESAVREAAATFAFNLRGEPLGPHRSLIASFIASRAGDDPTQLLLTLEEAPTLDHELTLQVAHRIVDVHGGDVGDIQTSAAGDVRYLTKLLLRSYSLAEDDRVRSQLLDVIDRLLEAGAYGIAEAIDEFRR